MSFSFLSPGRPSDQRRDVCLEGQPVVCALHLGLAGHPMVKRPREMRGWNGGNQCIDAIKGGLESETPRS